MTLPALVSTEWLARELGAPDLRVLDASWYLPQQKRDPKAEFLSRHIPGAVFFDIDALSDASVPLPHTFPPAEDFARKVGALGIGDGDRIVAYDGMGLFSAGRAWWMFRAMGHDKVAVLDGGMPKWLAEGRQIETGEARPAPRAFTARPVPGLIRSFHQMMDNVKSRGEQVLDARSRGRFTGAEPEPRPGMRSGHIPGSMNLPYDQLTDPKTGTVLPSDVLARKFRDAGLDLSKPVVTSCGSGITASALALGLYLAGKRDVAVYDGSWSEWGSRQDTPIET